MITLATVSFFFPAVSGVLQSLHEAAHSEPNFSLPVRHRFKPLLRLVRSRLERRS